jgi:flagellar biosynthesis anti-sigma factor FlgM
VNIDRVSQNLANGAYGLRGKRSQETGESGGVGSSSGSRKAPSADGLSLSSEGKALGRAQSAVRAAPDVREQLVERLRQEVQSGRYVTKDVEIARLLAEGANG